MYKRQNNDDPNVDFSDQEFFSYDDIVYSIDNVTTSFELLRTFPDSTIDSSEVDFITQVTVLDTLFAEDTADCVVGGGGVIVDTIPEGIFRTNGLTPERYVCEKIVDDTTFIYDTVRFNSEVYLWTLLFTSSDYSVELGIPFQGRDDQEIMVNEVQTYDISTFGDTAYAHLTLKGLDPDTSRSGLVNIISYDGENIEVSFAVNYISETLTGKYEGKATEVD